MFLVKFNAISLVTCIGTANNNKEKHIEKCSFSVREITHACWSTHVYGWKCYMGTQLLWIFMSNYYVSLFPYISALLAAL